MMGNSRKLTCSTPTTVADSRLVDHSRRRPSPANILYRPRNLFGVLVLIVALTAGSVLAQPKSGNQYEVEILTNPNRGGKDTREVNSVLKFGEDSIVISSRRGRREILREFKYADIKFVEHSFSRRPFMSTQTQAVIWGLLTGIPLYFPKKDKHWLTIMSADDFAVLKIENDNYRLIRMEFMVRRFEFITVDESK